MPTIAPPISSVACVWAEKRFAAFDNPVIALEVYAYTARTVEV